MKLCHMGMGCDISISLIKIRFSLYPEMEEVVAPNPITRALSKSEYHIASELVDETAVGRIEGMGLQTRGDSTSRPPSLSTIRVLSSSLSLALLQQSLLSSGTSV